MGDCIYISSEKPELTKEEMEALGIKPIREPFRRVPGAIYYFVSNDGAYWSREDEGGPIEEYRYSAANYCLDQQIMRQRAMYETLNRLLWRFSEMNGGRGFYALNIADYEHINVFVHPVRFLDPSFKTHAIAQRAIDEVVRPFLSAHPDFDW